MTSDRCRTDSHDTKTAREDAPHAERPLSSSRTFRRFLVVLCAAAFAVMAMGMEVASLHDELQVARSGVPASQCLAGSTTVDLTDLTD